MIISPMKKQLKKIFVVSHDAGGAEVVSAYVKCYQKKYNFYCYVIGPAVKIFRKRHLEKYFVSDSAIRTADDILDRIGAVDLVLTATSWSSDIELQFLNVAKKRGIRSVAYLDHWTNYRERFGYPNKRWRKCLPDEIWVGDHEALVLANRFGFPNVKLVPNQYFVEIQAKIKQLCVRQQKQSHSVRARRTILFISEPVAQGAKKMFNNPRYWGFTEQDVLEMVCHSIEFYNLSHKSHWQIVIRRHPSDSKHVYDSIINACLRKVAVAYSQTDDLIVDISRADLLVGMESMALVIGLLAGKKVISFIPSVKKKCRLPFKRITKIRHAGALNRWL